MRVKLFVDKARIAGLYAIGLSARDIAKAVGATRSQIKDFVRHHGLKRDPLRYAEGVLLLAQCGERFVETCTPGYWVSDRGRVIAMGSRPGTVMKPDRDRDGYLHVRLGAVRHAVHRLVARAFHGAPDPGQTAAHNNGIRDDNRADNIRWATQRENIADKATHGTAQIGSKHPRSLIDESAAGQIKAALRDGHTAAYVAERFRISLHIVHDISARRTWRHVP